MSNYIFLNKSRFTPSTIYHEFHHNEVASNILPAKLNSQNIIQLNNAYPTPRKPLYLESNNILEKRAINEELRKKVVDMFYDQYSRLPNINRHENELYDFLINMNDNDFRKLFRDKSLGGYLSDYLQGIRERQNDLVLSTNKSMDNLKSESRNYIKYAIGNIPVWLVPGLYFNYNNKKGD